MKKKTNKASFETIHKLFLESWQKHKLASSNWLQEWTKTREENGWGMDEFDEAIDKFQREEAEKAARKVA